MKVQFTQTSGNAQNGIRGQRVRIYVDDEQKYQLTIPSKYGAWYYMSIHPNSQYTKKIREAIDTFVKKDYPIPTSSYTTTI
jgi:hypothetical protein